MNYALYEELISMTIEEGHRLLLLEFQSTM